MNGKKVTVKIDSKNLTKTLSSRMSLALIFFLYICTSAIFSGCFLIAREPPAPPEYLFKEDLEGFKAFLEEDPEIVKYEITTGFYDDPPDSPMWGICSVQVQIDNDAWANIDEISRDRVLPRITREVLLGMEEDVYYYRDLHIRMREVIVFFYLLEEGSSSKAERVTFKSDDKVGYNRWSVEKDGGEGSARLEDYLSPEEAYIDSEIYENREARNATELNAMLVSREPAVDWLCTYTSDRENLSGGRAGEKCFVTKIQLNDDSVTYEEVERLFKDLVTGENGRILKKIRSSEEGMWLFSGRTTAMKVVFLVNGRMEYISFESYDKSGFGKWTVTQSFPDPSKEGRVISSISAESVLTGIGITVVVLAAVGAVTYILVRRLRRNKKIDLKQDEAGKT